MRRADAAILVINARQVGDLQGELAQAVERAAAAQRSLAALTAALEASPATN